MQNVIIHVSNPALPDAVRLMAQLDDYLNQLYPAESNHLMPIAALQRPNVTFVVAKVDSQVAGCGALVNQGTYAELKRMYVVSEFRGLKIGRQLLQALENMAQTAGLPMIRLETGISQPAAIKLYQRSGYQPCEPFGDYSHDPLSLFMAKQLQPTS